MFPGSLAIAVNMFHMDVRASNGKTSNDLEEIEILNYNEEGRLELEKNIEELEYRIEISDENTERQQGAKGRTGIARKLLKARIDTSRKLSKACDQEDYIIDLAQTPEVIETQKASCDATPRDWELRKSDQPGKGVAKGRRSGK